MISVNREKHSVIITGENSLEIATKMATRYDGHITKDHKTAGYTVRFDEGSFRRYLEDNAYER